MDIAEVLKRIKRPERVARINLAGDLLAEHTLLQQEIVAAEAASKQKMGASGRVAELAAQIRDLEERMQASVVEFRMQGLSEYQRDEWLAAHPPREGKQEVFNPSTGSPALVALCCVDPEMTEEQAIELRKVAGMTQFGLLSETAWQATVGDSSVPFSSTASAVRPAPATK